MWWCPSCLSMRWTSSTRCQDTCWTWMTRQALWLPWQRQCWLAVSPRLVFHWQVPRSSEGEPRDYYLQADLSQTHSYHHHCATCPSAWHYLHYVLRRSSRFNARCPLVRVGSFSYDMCALKANCCLIHFWSGEVNAVNLLKSFWRWSDIFVCYAKARDVFSLHPLRAPLFFSVVGPNGPGE